MSEKGLTTIALKKINRSKIYQYIYRSKLTSKLQIVQDLQMGLSTVSQNLNLLENEGLIEKNGYFDSTGGRKANAIQIVSDFRISIGVGILKNMFHITAIDLYGNTVYTDTITLTYSNTAAYYQQITDKVKDFIDKNQYPENKILGVSIATQGITSPDNTTVIYGNIMNNTGMRLKDFSRHLPYPCHLEHDSKSAAFLELWNHPELDSAVVLLLNRNLGGAIITNHQIHQGRSMHSGTIEHICVNPDGPLCYCGNRGCLETYCSANSLEQASGMTIKEFFPLLREKKSPQLIQIIQGSSLYRLQTIADIRKCPGNDNAHGIIYIGFLHHVRIVRGNYILLLCFHNLFSFQTHSGACLKNHSCNLPQIVTHILQKAFFKHTPS